MRSPGASELGPWSYEALDAKLARAEKPTYVLQLCFYSDCIASVQGRRPEHMHVLLGIGEQRTLRYDDFAAYYRRVRARFEESITLAKPTRPIRWSIAACATSAGCVDRVGLPKIISCRWREFAASRSCDYATAGCRR
jgi:predicted RecB family nuclease